MQKPFKIALLALGFVVAGIGTVGAAEETPAAPADPAAPGAPSSGAPSETNLSAPEMVARAKGAVAAIDTTASVIARMLRDARAQKDVVKVLCLDDKLNQIDVAKRSVSERADAMSAALSAGNTDRLEFDFAVVGALEERANSLSAEANQCIGEEKGFVGGAKLEVTVDPDIPTQDTSAPPSPIQASSPPVTAVPIFSPATSVGIIRSVPTPASPLL